MSFDESAGEADRKGENAPLGSEHDDDEPSKNQQSQANREAASTSRSIATSSMYLVIRRFGILGLSFFSTIVITRALGPSDYGDLQSSLATWGLVLALCDFGISMALVREMAQNTDAHSSLLRASFFVQGAWSFVVGLAMVAIALFSSTNLSQHAQILLILAPSVLVSAMSSGKTLFRVRYELGYTVMVDLTTTLVQVLLSIAAALLGYGAIGVAVVISISSIVNSTWIGLAAHRRSRAPQSAPWKSSVRTLVKAALPLGTMSLLSGAYLTIDLVILGFMSSGGSVGRYAAAVKVVTLANTVPGLLVNAAMPGFSASADDEHDSGYLFGRLLHWMAALALPVFLAAGLYATLISSILFGREFTGVAGLISILAIAGLVGTLSQTMSIVLISASRVRPLIVQNTLATVFNVGMNIWLIPLYGAVACAWLTVATECIVCLGSAWTLFHTMKFRCSVTSSRPVILVVLGSSGVAVLLALVNDYISLATFAVLFTCGMLTTRSWPVEFLPAKFARWGSK